MLMSHFSKFSVVLPLTNGIHPSTWKAGSLLPATRATCTYSSKSIKCLRLD